LVITTQILLIERKVECGRSDESDLLRRRRQHARASCAYSVKRMYGIDKGVDCAATTHAIGTVLRLLVERWAPAVPERFTQLRGQLLQQRWPMARVPIRSYGVDKGVD